MADRFQKTRALRRHRYLFVRLLIFGRAGGGNDFDAFR